MTRSGRSAENAGADRTGRGERRRTTNGPEVLAPEFPLHTARLLLRSYTEDDLDFLAELESHPQVTRYVSWPPRDRDQVRESLAKKRTETALRGEGESLTPVLVLFETGTPVGDVQLRWSSREHRQGEIGYVIHPEHAGNGYATEAAELMLRLGFDQLGLHRIVGSMDRRNTASARVLEHVGMRREACLVGNQLVKGEWTDEVIYAMLADEWQARH
jgi:RimJ/RimL family protein N-acetyltransferase